jgi:protoheme IX farnesyltransferase
MLKNYFQLTKPGIIAGNIVTCIGGFLLAKNVGFAPSRFIAVVAGSCLIIGGACVINNYIDRGIDSQMKRTAWRKNLTTKISLKQGSVYATGLLACGFGLLALLTNWLTVLVGVIGLLVYVVFYSYMKRRSVHGTLVGCVAGAMPAVAGYTAASDRFNMAALLLLLILTFWQLAHFYAIAIYRLNDYSKSKLPVMPVVKGINTTKTYIYGNIMAFGICASLLSAFHYTGYIFLASILLISLGWLYRGIKLSPQVNDLKWARSMFLYSLIVITALSAGLPLGRLLP